MYSKSCLIFKMESKMLQVVNIRKFRLQLVQATRCDLPIETLTYVPCPEIKINVFHIYNAVNFSFFCFCVFDVRRFLFVTSRDSRL